MLLDTTQNVARALNIKEMKVVNLGGGNETQADPAGALMASVMAGFKTVSNTLE